MFFTQVIKRYLDKSLFFNLPIKKKVLYGLNILGTVQKILFNIKKY